MGKSTSFRAADSIEIALNPEPVKLNGEAAMNPQDLMALSQQCAKCLIEYTKKTRGTCGDERGRKGLLNGEPVVEARPSAWGGPNIYGLFMAELSGKFIGSELSGIDRLAQVTKTINSADITSGGHLGCAANGSFRDILAIISEHTNWSDAAAQQLGGSFDSNLAKQLAANAQAALDTGVYDNWQESNLQAVLGDEAKVAIEELVPGPHTARLVERVWIEGRTIDQTRVVTTSNGETSFVQDEPYCQRIEDAIGGNDLTQKPLLRHAREALLQAVVMAVPNSQLWLGSIK